MKPLTDEALDALLYRYGATPQPAFVYRPRPVVLRRRFLPIAATVMTLLLLILSAGAIALVRDRHPLPSATTPAPLLSSSPSVTDPTVPAVTTPSKNPPVTAPETLPPPNTEEPPTVLLGSWYSAESVRLLHCFDLNAPFVSQNLIQLDEIYCDYDAYEVELGDYSSSLVSGSMVLTTGVGVGHTEAYCSTACLQNLLTGEVICLGHEVQELLAGMGMSVPPKVYFVHTSEDGSQNVITAENRYYFYDRTARRLTEIEFDLREHSSLSFSPDCRYMVVEKPRAGESVIGDLWLLDLQTMESRLIEDRAPTAGMSTFSADGRYFITYLMENGAVEQNEDAKWLLYDTQTHESFEGEGKLLYFYGGVIISRTPDGFRAYDCQTGDLPADLSDLPGVAVISTRAYRHTISLYHPGTGELTFAFANLGAYAISPDYRYLYTYTAHDTHVEVTDLYSGESFRLPLSKRFLEESTPGENEKTIFSLSVHPDGGEIQIRYFVSHSAAFDEMQEDIKDFQQMMEEEFLNAPNLPAFWERFRILSAPYSSLIKGIYYDIHDGYVNLQISYIYTAYTNPSGEKAATTISYFVEDYRSDTFTLFIGYLNNPCRVGGVYGRSAGETARQTFRKKLVDGSYEASCALLTTVGEKRIVYIDFGKCFDASGKWKDSLEKAEFYRYENLRAAAFYSNLVTNPQDENLNRLVELITRYPLTKRESIHQTHRMVGDIYLYTVQNHAIYHAQIYITADGKYYLSDSRFNWDEWGCRRITEDEYIFLMQLQGGFLYESGMYMDKRIASLPLGYTGEAATDYLNLGVIPISSNGTDRINGAVAMLRAETYTHQEIFEYLFSPELRQYIALLSEYKSSHTQTIYTYQSMHLKITLENGVITFSDPHPNKPLPNS